MPDFVRITAVIRPHKLQEVKSALALLPISGLTVTDARGTGNHPEKPVSFLGQNMVVPLPIRIVVEVAVPEALSDEVIEAIKAAAHTGEPGDGKIFIEPILDAVRIRTKESGLDAI